MLSDADTGRDPIPGRSAVAKLPTQHLGGVRNLLSQLVYQPVRPVRSTSQISHGLRSLSAKGHRGSSLDKRRTSRCSAIRQFSVTRENRWRVPCPPSKAAGTSHGLSGSGQTGPVSGRTPRRSGTALCPLPSAHSANSQRQHSSHWRQIGPRLTPGPRQHGTSCHSTGGPLAPRTTS